MATTFDFSAQVVQVFTFKLDGGEVAKFIASMALTVIHISFYNMSGGTALTSAASVANAGSTIASSSAVLAADTTEEKEGGDLSNTTIANGADVTVTAGDLPTAIAISCYPTYTP